MVKPKVQLGVDKCRRFDEYRWVLKMSRLAYRMVAASSISALVSCFYCHQALAADDIAAAVSGRCGKGVALAWADHPADVVGDFNGDGKPDRAVVVSAEASVAATVPDSFGYGPKAGAQRMLAVLWGHTNDCVLLGGETPALYADIEQITGDQLISTKKAKGKSKRDQLVIATQAAEGKLSWAGKDWKWVEEGGGE